MFGADYVTIAEMYLLDESDVLATAEGIVERALFSCPTP
jgi:hypothetical protein